MIILEQEKLLTEADNAIYNSSNNDLDWNDPAEWLLLTIPDGHDWSPDLQSADLNNTSGLDIGSGLMNPAEPQQQTQVQLHALTGNDGNTQRSAKSDDDRMDVT